MAGRRRYCLAVFLVAAIAGATSGAIAARTQVRTPPAALAAAPGIDPKFLLEDPAKIPAL